MIRNVLICTTQVPFTSGGAESHVEGLRRALFAAGYSAEIVALPFKWYPPTEIMRGALAWRMLDASAANGKPVDLVIGMKFPAYLVARSEEHTSELQSQSNLVCRLLLEKKKKTTVDCRDLSKRFTLNVSNAYDKPSSDVQTVIIPTSCAATSLARMTDLYSHPTASLTLV